MKRCPACDNTFPDGMKFCQIDGTVLVDDAAVVDPYKTMVGNQFDNRAAPPPDPFKTTVASPSKPDEDDILQLPEEPDLMKTMLVPRNEVKRDLKADESEDVPPLDLPPAPSAPLIKPQAGSSSNAGSINSSFSPDDAPQFGSKPFQNDFSGQSPYGNTDNLPIPSPFQDSMPPGSFQPPSNSPFDEPKLPPKESEPMYREPQESSGQSPFGNAEPFNQPLGQAEWTPPPAPVANWQNQNLGADTPFHPPTAPAGQDQTLAIVSLVLGILSIPCCGFVVFGIAAVITGFLAKKKADENPNQFGGRGMALAGMIIGAITTVLGLILTILQIFFGILGRLG